MFGPLKKILAIVGICQLATVPKLALCGQTFHNQFALFIPSGQSNANSLASKHGFINLGQIGSLDNYFLFEHPRLKRRSASFSANHTAMLLSEPDVEWAEQMVEKRRLKRDFQPILHER